ncbi:MAG: hypothetical protein ACR2HJ_05905 [Fimbriimonadales bacterium]
MKLRIPLLLAMLPLASVGAQSPLALKFAKGETLRYLSSVSASQSAKYRGETFAIKMSGSNTMVISVKSVANGKALMSVSYTSSQSAATATSLPEGAKKDRVKIEAEAARAIKATLSGGARSQTVRSNGSSTYSIPMKDGQSMTIQDGAFMMLILPKGAPNVNTRWTANIRMPIPGATRAMPVKYKLVGTATYNGQAARKIVFSTSDSESKKQGDVAMKVRIDVKGHFLLNPATGKIVQGEVNRSVKTTLTHAKEGTRTSEQSSVQTFKKV